MHRTETRRPRWSRLATLVTVLATSLLAMPATAPATAPATVDAAPHYRIVDLGLSHYSQAYGINARGHIVGDHNGVAFLWRHGRVTYLDPSADYSVATDINDRDEVVGYRSPGGAFRWRDSVFTDLGVDGFAVAVNDRGEVAVSGAAGEVYHWRDGTLTPLAGLPGAYSRAADINNAGVIVGESGPMNTEAVRWRNGEIEVLAGVPPASNAEAVNDRGQITGRYFPGPTGFVWHRGRYADITPPPGYWMVQPHGMNNRGQIVGDTIGTWNQAFVWQRGEFTLLPRLVPNGSTTAQDVNDQGQVAGYAVSDPTGTAPNFRAVLWTR